MRHIIIGSRGSDLALWQANFVKDELKKLNCSVEISIIKTQGDVVQNLSFDKLEGKGFFTKEIEEALLNRTVDLAVHSHKDLETKQPEGLQIACVSERANPSDLLLINKGAVDHSLKWSLIKGAIVGTSSSRRKAQALEYRGDIAIKELRGNVPTRIEKLRSGNYDAIIIAKAGVDRLNLNLSEFEEVVLDPQEFVPAPAQGVLALQIRKDDDEIKSILQKMNHPTIQKRVQLERRVLNLLEGGCQLPLGVYCDEKNHLFVSYKNSKEEGCISLDYQVLEFHGMAEKVVADLKQKIALG